MELAMNLDDLTIEEVEIIEDILDAPFETAFTAGAKRGKAMRALAFVTMRRSNPDVTLEEAGKVPVTGFTGGKAADPSGPNVA